MGLRWRCFSLQQSIPKPKIGFHERDNLKLSILSPEYSFAEGSLLGFIVGEGKKTSIKLFDYSAMEKRVLYFGSHCCWKRNVRRCADVFGHPIGTWDSTTTSTGQNLGLQTHTRKEVQWEEGGLFLLGLDEGGSFPSYHTWNSTAPCNNLPLHY